MNFQILVQTACVQHLEFVITPSICKLKQECPGTAQERKELRARQKAIEEAELARRRRVTVTFDIMGRQAGRRRLCLCCWLTLL